MDRDKERENYQYVSVDIKTTDSVNIANKIKTYFGKLCARKF